MKLDFTIGSDNLVHNTSLTCRYKEMTWKGTFIPGEDTRRVVVDFSSKMAEFWFRRFNSGVIYFYRRGELIIVGKK